jgi:hypothetical protein
MDKYFIDPHVISLLFQEDNEEKIQDIYSDISQRIVIVTEKSTESFLKEKGLSEDQIANIKSSEDHDLFDDNIKSIMKDPALREKIEKNVDELLKIYFDDLMPRMPAEKRAELEQYIKDANEVRVMQNEDIKADLQETKDLLEYYEAKDLNEALEKSNDPNFKKENPTPSINLGGASTNISEEQEVVSSSIPNSTPLTTTETPIPVIEQVPDTTPVATEGVEEEVIADTTTDTPKAEDIKLPQDSNLEEVSPIVDMALQSAISTPQPHVFDQEVPAETPQPVQEIVPENIVATIQESTLPEEVNIKIPTPPAPPVKEMIMPMDKVTEPPVAELPETETITPESIQNNEIQFTPLTEVPMTEVPTEAQSPAELNVPTSVPTPAEVTATTEPPTSILDNQLPPLPDTLPEEPVIQNTDQVPAVETPVVAPIASDVATPIAVSEEAPMATEVVSQPEVAQPTTENVTLQSDAVQPTSAAAKLDSLGINLEDGAANTQQ